MFAADASYKTNKAKLMRDVRLLRTFCDGKILVSTANDAEQLRILIGKSKKQVGITDSDMIKLNTENESPIKTKPELKSDIEESAASTRGNQAIPDSSEGRNSKRKKKHKKQKKAKKRSRERTSSSSSSEGQTRHINLFQDRNTSYGVGTFPHLLHHGSGHGFQLHGYNQYNPIVYQPSSYPPYAAASGPGVHVMNSASGMQTMPSNVNVWNYRSQYPQVESWQNLDTLAAAATDNVTENNSPDNITL